MKRKSPLELVKAHSGDSLITIPSLAARNNISNRHHEDIKVSKQSPAEIFPGHGTPRRPQEPPAHHTSASDPLGTSQFPVGCVHAMGRTMNQPLMTKESRSLLFAPPGTHHGAQMRVLLSEFRDGRPCIEFRLYVARRGSLQPSRDGLALTLAEFDAIVRLVRNGVTEEVSCAA